MNVKFYRDDDKNWRWQLSAANKAILAASAESYEDVRDAVAGFEQTTQCELRLYNKGWRSVRNRNYNRIFVDGLPRS